jgi:small subunit ribosomal protein S20
MPIIKSAKKRVRVAEKASIRNSKTKRSLRTAIKAFHKAITGGDKNVTELHSDAQSNVDKAVKKGVMHKNKAARQKSQLAARAKAAATAAPAAKKAAPKKAAAKPAAAKKPAAKKPVAKKPAAKKAAK